MNSGNAALSLVLSVIAMTASGVTTYLTFFDERYQVTAAIAQMQMQTQTNYSREGDGPYKMTYRIFMGPTLILSNQGTRAVVVSDVTMHLSQDGARCVQADNEEAVELTRLGAAEPLILEAGDVKYLTMEFGAPAVTDDFERKTSLWCAKFVLYDHKGQWIEAAVPAATTEMTIQRPPAGSDDPPELAASYDVKRTPYVIAKGGWIAALSEE